MIFKFLVTKTPITSGRLPPCSIVPFTSRKALQPGRVTAPQRQAGLIRWCFWSLNVNFSTWTGELKAWLRGCDLRFWLLTSNFLVAFLPSELESLENPHALRNPSPQAPLRMEDQSVTARLQEVGDGEFVQRIRMDLGQKLPIFSYNVRCFSELNGIWMIDQDT